MAVEIKQYIPTELKRATAKAICDLFLASSDRPITFFISGGSCLSLLSGITQELFSQNIQKLNLTMLFGDERLEYENSNERELKSVYAQDLSKLLSLKATFIPLPIRKTLEQASKSYEEVVVSLLENQNKKNGIVVTLLGMGLDGHIAGIFPLAEQRIFYPLYLDTPKIVVGHPFGEKPLTNRITLTFPGLLKSQEIIVFATGEEKTKMLKNALYDNPPLNENPALFFIQNNTKTQVFTDVLL